MDDIVFLFRRYPSQKKVAQKLLQYGIKVIEGKAYCGDVEQSEAALARACEVDRRVVKSTLDRISSEPELNAIFSRLMPMLSMDDMASEIGCSSITIMPIDARIPGILADVTTLLFESGVTLRQATIVDDGQREKSVLNIVVDGRIQDNLIMLLKSCRGVASVLIK